MIRINKQLEEEATLNIPNLASMRIPSLRHDKGIRSIGINAELKIVRKIAAKISKTKID